MIYNVLHVLTYHNWVVEHMTTAWTEALVQKHH